MDLKNQAIQILRSNWKGGFTIPTSKLYPFQWLWDSGFVALGTSHFDLDKSIEEIRSMFSGQWENGMIPHILFHSEEEKTYFPNYDFWESSVNEGAPRSPKSSGITQPPVFGFVLESLLKLNPDNQHLEAFAKEIFPKMVNFHKCLYETRDPNQEGLFYIFHPWESGRDNSPIWDEAMNKIEIDKDELPNYTRRDTSIANPDERPTTDQYDRYVYLLELGKKHKYNGIDIAKESPFLIQDAMMNAILIKSNEALIAIGNRFGFDVSQLESWQKLSKTNFEKKFWNEELEIFVSYDLRNEKQIVHKEIGGLVALFAGVASEQQAQKMHDYLKSIHQRGYFLCPSFDIDSPLFDSKRYWRGPIWPQMNWMIYHGLLNYNYNELAEIVKNDLISLVSRLGFYEYFESEKTKVKNLKNGYGGNNFSWTASTFLSLMNQE